MVICFTGHRPAHLCGYTIDSYIDFQCKLTNYLQTYCINSNETITFVSGGAQGFDQIAFWAINELQKNYPNYNIINTIYIPFKGQERQWLKTGLFGQNQYHNMINNANNAVYLKNELSNKYDIINALYNRNHKMVDDSDIVIALYNGNDWNKTKGGTAECIRYAKNQNKTVLCIPYEIENNKLIFNEPIAI